MSKQKHDFCTQFDLNLYFSGNSMNNLLSYCGLTDARMRASEKDLPVQRYPKQIFKLKVSTYVQDFNYPCVQI